MVTRRMFAAMASVTPAVLSSLPKGLVVGKTMRAPAEEVMSSEWAERGSSYTIGDTFTSPSMSVQKAIQKIWKIVGRRKNKRVNLEKAIQNHSAGMLDPDIQALHSCSPVFKIHLQNQRYTRENEYIQKLHDRISELENLKWGSSNSDPLTRPD